LSAAFGFDVDVGFDFDVVFDFDLDVALVNPTAHSRKPLFSDLRPPPTPSAKKIKTNAADESVRPTRTG
jgi:hypothetical protein